MLEIQGIDGQGVNQRIAVANPVTSTSKHLHTRINFAVVLRQIFGGCFVLTLAMLSTER